MNNQQKWKDKSKSIIKTELAKRNIDFVKLSKMLETIGIKEDNVNRGTFSFIFALQIFEVLDLDILKIKEKDYAIVS